MPPPPRIPDELTRGPFSLAQAEAVGVTRDQLRGRSWRRIGRGMYVLARRAGQTDMRLSAALASLPVGATLAGLTAAGLYGFSEPGEQLEVIVPAGRALRSRAGVIVRNLHLEGEDVTRLRGLPVTTPLRTCFDLACGLPLVEAAVAVDAALHARLVSLDVLTRYVAARPGLPGVRQARQVLELAEPAAESPMETRLRLVLVLAGLPRPLAQVSLRDDAGEFLARPDLYYPQARLAIEYDGGTHRESLTADNRRQNRLQRSGVRLLRYTAPDVYGRQDAIAAEVRALLRR
ncbi:MAG: DUF559 domain-containing protein [Candidatus Dormibacteraeota bacterium]|nr:DUF559 domain-containing protein [Candidatus Dormibacteraeota bacterium]